MFGPVMLLPAQSTFTTAAGSYSWGDSANWTPAVIPNAVDAGAIFLTPAGAQTVNHYGLHRTVGSLSITNNSAFPIAFNIGTDVHRINFGVSSGNASLLVAGTGDNTTTIASRVNLDSNLNINVANVAATDPAGALALTFHILGTGRIIKDGPGTVTIGGTGAINSYAGGIAINDGTVRIDGTTASALGAIPGTFVADQIAIDGGRLELDATGTTNFLTGLNRGFTLGSNNAEIAATNTRPLVVQGVTSGPGHLTKTGTGTVSLTAANTYTGGTTVASGTLLVSDSSGLGTGPVQLGSTGGGDAAIFATLANRNQANAITVAAGSGGTLTLGGTSTATFNTTFSGSLNVLGNLTVSSVSPEGYSLILAGQISGSGNITKVDTGQLSIEGANLWAGSLNIAAGSVAFASGSEMRFALQDEGISNQIHGVGDLAVGGEFIIDRSAVTMIGSWLLVDVASLNSSAFAETFGLRFADDESSFAGLGDGLFGAGDWTFDAGTGQLTLIPEPGHIGAMAGLLAIAVIFFRRRR